MAINPSTFNLADLTVQYFKDTYLTGLVFRGVDGAPLKDAFFQNYLDLACAKLEEETSVDITQKTITDEKHDYRIQDYVQFAFLKLYRAPVISVTQVQAIYPTGQVIQVFPNEWVRLEEVGGQIQLVPTAGTLSQVIIGQGADYLPLIFSGINYLPQLWHVDYISGFDATKVPRTIIDALCKQAAIDVLIVGGNMSQPIGVQSHSTSVDGLSQSRSYLVPPFKALIDQYTKDLKGEPGEVNKGLINNIRSYYHGIGMGSI